MGFDYDQEVAAFAVQRILSGDFTLIGQEISIGGVFIGPGYYYLLSIFYWLFAGDPLGAGVMVSLFSVATMVLLFSVSRSLTNIETAFIALTLFATSSKIIFFDRTTAPSNLLMLSALLVLFILIQIKKYGSKLVPLLSLILSGAVIHIHPTAITLAPIIFFLWRLWKLAKPNPSQILMTMIAALLPLSPLIIFDLKNNFLNLRGVFHATGIHGSEAYFFLLKFLLLVRIQIENLASLFPFGNLNLLIAISFVFIFIRYSKKENRQLLVGWVLMSTMTLSFYTRHVPEYYLLPSLPALLIIAAVAIRLIIKTLPNKVILTAFLSIVLWNGYLSLLTDNPYSLLYRQQTVDYIKTAQKEDVYVSFDTDYGLESGFHYLLKVNDVKIADKDHIPSHTIIMPPDRRIAKNREVTFGGIKVIENIERTSINHE